jgi:hypothetical protein
MSLLPRSAPAADRRRRPRTPWLVVAVALVLAYGVGLVLHLAHAGAHEGHAIDPTLHWLRDSSLAVPASLLAVALSTFVVRRLVRSAGWSPSGLPAIALWVLAGATAYAVLSVPGIHLHQVLFAAEHDEPFAAHAVRDGSLVLAAATNVLALIAVLQGIAGRLLAPVAGGARVALGWFGALVGPRKALVGAAAAMPAAAVAFAASGVVAGNVAAIGGGVCPAGARDVVYDLSAFQTVIPLNGWGDKLPDGLMYALKNPDARVGKQQILANANLTQPLTIRANVGDCVTIRLKNDIVGRRVGIHTGGLVRQDVKGLGGADGDGAYVGNNADSTLGFGAEREYRWYADRVGESAITDVANLDGANPSATTIQRGLYGALVVHPKGSTWRNPKTGNDLLATDPDGSRHAVETALFADIEVPNAAPLRSYAMVFMDENEGVVDRDGQTPFFPTSGQEDSTFGINYRSEPLRNRVRAVLEHRGAKRWVRVPGTAEPDPAHPNEPPSGFKLVLADPASADPEIRKLAEAKTMKLPNGRVIKPTDHFCDGYVPEVGKVVDDPGARCLSEESHLQSWPFGDEGKLSRAINEQQSVALAGAAGGTFTLSFDGQTTAGIDFNAGAPAVTAALEALPNIDQGDVTVGGDAASGLTVEFGGQFEAKDVPQLVADPAGLLKNPQVAAADVKVATVRTADRVTDSDNLIPKAYVGDHVTFHVIHPGAKETHPWHQHTQRWFADPHNHNGPNGENVSPRNDVQSIGPGDSRELTLEEGAGGLQRTVGDSIFHCHLYPHFAQGFWGHLRIFDRVRDHENNPQSYPDGTPLETLKKLPDDTRTPSPDAAHPGFPLFVKGDFGQRAYRPPNTVIKDQFAQLRRPGDAPRGPNALEAANMPALSTPEVSPDGSTNGTARPGSGVIDPCPAGAPKRVYHPTAVDTPIKYNSAGWTDREGRVYIEGGKDPMAAAREQLDPATGKNPEPYTIRSRVGECVEIQTTNALHLDDDPNEPIDHLHDKDGEYFSEEETSEVSTHVHLVQFDELGSDGTSVGWNYSQSAMPGQTYGYRWFVDEPLRTVFFHDHQYANLHQQKGLFAAMNVEPADAEWRDPKTGNPTNGVGTVADIVSPTGKDFREFTVFHQDRAPMWRNGGAGAAVDPPAQVDDFGADQGGVGLNLRNEPFQIRTDPTKTGNKGDPAFVLSSAVHGDPSTPVFRAYSQDPVVIRNVVGAHEEAHTFNVHGHRWLNQPDDPKSQLTDSQSATLAEYFNYEISGGQVVKRNAPAKETLAKAANTDANGTPAILAGGAGRPGDYLYGSQHLDDMWLGAWGIFRVPAGNTGDLAPLPDRVAANESPDTIYLENEVQKITLTGSPTGGSFTLTYGGKTTAAIAYNATAATVQTALQALTTIGTGNVTVTGNAGGPYTVTFVGSLAHHDVPALTATSSLTVTTVATTRPGITIDVTNPVTLDPWPALRPGAALSQPNGAGVNPCPASAPVRAYDVTAVKADIVYNAKSGDHDPVGLIYMPTSDVTTNTAGVATIKSTAKPKPLFVRANAGDCLKVTLRNGLPSTGLPAHDGDVPLPADAPFPKSARVSMHPSLVRYDPLRSDGATVGYNYDQTVAPGKALTYQWYADPALDGASANLLDFGDRRGHRHHGLWGGLFIEPKGAKWYDSTTGLSLEGTPNAKTGVIEGTKTSEAAVIKWTDANGVAQAYREFAIDIQDGLNLRTPTGGPVPVDGHVDDPYEQGNRGINLRTERFAPRLAKDPEEAHVLSSTVHGDPATPVFRARLGDRVRLRVLQGQDRGRAHTFLLHGHEWPNQYTDPGSYPLTGSTTTAIDPNSGSFKRSSQDGVLTGRALTYDLLGGAGGRQQQTGDYLFRDGLLINQTNAGLWGLLRVEPTTATGLMPLK